MVLLRNFALYQWNFSACCLWWQLFKRTVGQKKKRARLYTYELTESNCETRLQWGLTHGALQLTCGNNSTSHHFHVGLHRQTCTFLPLSEHACRRLQLCFPLTSSVCFVSVNLQTGEIPVLIIAYGTWGTPKLHPEQLSGTNLPFAPPRRTEERKPEAGPLLVEVIYFI